MRRVVCCAVAAFAAMGFGRESIAQAASAPSVVGVVRDSAGAPVGSAEVTVMGRKTTTDSLGRFFLTHSSTDTVAISVRRLGYESVSFSLSAADVAKNAVDVVLRRLGNTLETVNVREMEIRAQTSLAGFDSRRERGLGSYVTRADIEQRNTRLLSDVLRQQRGMIVGRGGALRFATHQSKRCVPTLWLDGARADGLSVDAISATEVEGVELYQSMSTTPPEFHRGNVGVECGTIVIWTKRPILEQTRKKP